MLLDDFSLNMAAQSNVSFGEQSSSLVNYFPVFHHNMSVLVSWQVMWTHANGLLKYNYTFSLYLKSSFGYMCHRHSYENVKV